MASNSNSFQTEIQIAFAAGHITAWLEIYAKSHGVPFASLAYRVAQTLQLPQVWETLGDSERMPDMRNETSKRTGVQHASKDSLDVGSHSSVRRSKRKSGGLKKAPMGATKKTALTILNDSRIDKRDTRSVSELMVKRNPKIASVESAAQVLYKMKKDGKATQDAEGNWSLVA